MAINGIPWVILTMSLNFQPANEMEDPLKQCIVTTIRLRFPFSSGVVQKLFRIH